MAKTNTTPAAPVTAATVRAWAREVGMEVGARGRIHPSVIEAFNKGRKPAQRYMRPEEAPRAPRQTKELVSA